MPQTLFHGRKAVSIENSALRVTVLVEGGHIAEILHKASGVNPLWIPTWPSLEPTAFAPEHHAIYGGGSDGRLLAGIMGHNLCLDIFGGPSDEEAAMGLTAHGEGSVVSYRIDVSGGTLTESASFPLAAIDFVRRIALDGGSVLVREEVTSRAATDRPIGWTQHVTLAPPFLEIGKSEIRASATRSLVYEGTFGAHDYLRPGAAFDWPLAPRADAATSDRRLFTGASSSCAYTAHLMNPSASSAFFLVYSPGARVAIGYEWNQADFPWLGMWEENRSRQSSPWSGRAITLGMEFGVSPVPETRQAMVARGRLFNAPTFRWLPAGATLTTDYRATTFSAHSTPDTLPPF